MEKLNEDFIITDAGHGITPILDLAAAIGSTINTKKHKEHNETIV
jgi:hypothetical protein